MTLHQSSVSCAICRAPLDILRAQEARTCRLPACVHAYERLPDSRKCRYCGDLVAITSINPGRCEAARCRDAQSQGAIRAARAELIRLTLQVRQDRNAAVEALPGRRNNPAHYAAAMVPRNTAQMRRTAARRHKALEASIRQVLHTMRNTTASEDRPSWVQPGPMAIAVKRVIAATCTACRGFCCHAGGDHAFIRVDTLRAYAEAHPVMDDEAIVQAYLSYLPARALHPGCVYQGRRGCTLPRSMRSAICNKFLCTGLNFAISDGITDDTRGVYVAHRAGTEVYGGKLRALPVLE